jgi:hypothetical protein
VVRQATIEGLFTDKGNGFDAILEQAFNPFLGVEQDGGIERLTLASGTARRGSMDWWRTVSPASETVRTSARPAALRSFSVASTPSGRRRAPSIAVMTNTRDGSVYTGCPVTVIENARLCAAPVACPARALISAGVGVGVGVTTGAAPPHPVMISATTRDSAARNHCDIC